MMTTTILRITGMTCGHCRESVESALQMVGGVHSVRVDLDAGEAQVLHDEVADGRTLAAAVHDAGFEAQVDTG
jgi:copper chaperone